MLESLSFGETLRIAITRDGRLHRDVAASIGLSPTSLCNYLKGRCVPTDFRIIRALEGELKLTAGSLEILASQEKGDRRRKPVAA